MNILEIEDIIKGLPDNRLVQEAQAPTGRLPQFLVVSEIQRRADMRRRFQSQQEQPKGTVAEQIVSGGIGSLPQTSFTPPSPVSTNAVPPPAALTGAGEAPIPMMADGGLTGLSPLASRMLGRDSFGPEDLLRPEEDANESDQEEERAQSPLLNMSDQARLILESPLFSGIYSADIGSVDYTPSIAALEAQRGIEIPQADYSSLISSQKSALDKYAKEYQSLGDIYAAEAEKEATGIREQAKKDALTAALMQIGAGIAAGNVSAGLSGAAESVQQTMSEAQKQALAEKRAAKVSGREASEAARRLGIEAQQFETEMGVRGAQERVAALRESLNRDLEIEKSIAALRVKQGEASAESTARELQLKGNLATNLFTSLSGLEEQQKLSERAVIQAISEFIKDSQAPETMAFDQTALEEYRTRVINQAINLYGGFLSSAQEDDIRRALLESSSASPSAAPADEEEDGDGFSASDA